MISNPCSIGALTWKGVHSCTWKCAKPLLACLTTCEIKWWFLLGLADKHDLTYLYSCHSMDSPNTCMSMNQADKQYHTLDVFLTCVYCRRMHYTPSQHPQCDWIPAKVHCHRSELDNRPQIWFPNLWHLALLNISWQAFLGRVSLPQQLYLNEQPWPFGHLSKLQQLFPVPLSHDKARCHLLQVNTKCRSILELNVKCFCYSDFVGSHCEPHTYLESGTQQHSHHWDL